jgi:hypothetical protein
MSGSAAGRERVDETERIKQIEANVAVAIGGGVDLVKRIHKSQEVEDVKEAACGEVGVARL